MKKQLKEKIQRAVEISATLEEGKSILLITNKEKGYARLKIVDGYYEVSCGEKIANSWSGLSLKGKMAEAHKRIHPDSLEVFTDKILGEM